MCIRDRYMDGVKEGIKEEWMGLVMIKSLSVEKKNQAHLPLGLGEEEKRYPDCSHR